MKNSDDASSGGTGLWEEIYRSGRKVNQYPYDLVVSFVLRRFGAGDRPNTRILDYGCGGGNHARFLVAEGFDAYAVDSAPTAVHLSLSAAQTIRGDVDAAKFLTADFSRLPFPDNHFHAVIDRQSLGQNCAAQLPVMVREIWRVLAPGGVYFGINFSDRHPQLRFGRNLGDGDWTDFTGGVFKGLGQKHFFSATELTGLFADFNVESIEVLRHDFLLDASRGSEEFIVVACKPS